MPVIFITDTLIFLLLIMVVLFGWYSARHEHLRVPWRQVSENPLAMASAVILLFYVLVGLLDSMHFHPRLQDTKNEQAQYSTEIISVLDIFTEKLRTRTEKTYSAPFAAYAFSKEMITLPDGSEVRDYPRLVYGGSHLQNPEKEFLADIVLKTFTGMFLGIIIWLLVTVLIIVCLSRSAHQDLQSTVKAVIRCQGRIPWHVIFITTGVVLIIFVTVMWYRTIIMY